VILIAYRSNSSSKTATKSAVSLLLLVVLGLSGCSGNFKKVTFNSTEHRDYIEQLDRFRERKDSFFKSGASSPLTAAQRIGFKHLNYYPPNVDLVFEVKLIKEDSPERVGILATGGETRPAIRYGKFDFSVEGKSVRLYVYKMTGDGSSELFVPFTDKTCDSTSYSGGRYIDLDENDSGEYTLDFNYAYNPYCAYNHNYSCPIVPAENHLSVDIRAGEMVY
jgi:uncharacterized protein